MSDTLQSIRIKAQELLNLAKVDESFQRLLQTNADGVLCAAGVPNAHLSSDSSEVDCAVAGTCSWTCSWTCWITGREV
jgi:hypothetical protein